MQTLCWPRFSSLNMNEWSGDAKSTVSRRRKSGLPADSIFTTSAPRSRSMPHSSGTTAPTPSVTTRSPDSGGSRSASPRGGRDGGGREVAVVRAGRRCRSARPRRCRRQVAGKGRDRGVAQVRKAGAPEEPARARLLRRDELLGAVDGCDRQTRAGARAPPPRRACRPDRAPAATARSVPSAACAAVVLSIRTGSREAAPRITLTSVMPWPASAPSAAPKPQDEPPPVHRPGAAPAPCRSAARRARAAVVASRRARAPSRRRRARRTPVHRHRAGGWPAVTGKWRA